MEKADNEKDINETKLVMAVVLGILILLAALFISYRYSQKLPSDLILPGGVTYLGPSPTPSSTVK